MVINYHGVTRDINSGYIELDGKTIYIEDTGGIPEIADEFSQLIIDKVLKSISQAKLILFVVSAADGLTNQDKEICKMLRKLDRNTVLLVNKCDLTRKSQPISEFYELSGAGHLPCFESEKEFTQAILTFLSKHGECNS